MASRPTVRQLTLLREVIALNLDFRTIEYFLKVAERLSFTQAARELFISTQAVNRHIIRLEQALGEKLFIRTTRTVELTPFGKTMYDIFLPAWEAYEGALIKLDRALARRKRTVRIIFFNALPKAEVVSKVVRYILDHSSVKVCLEAVELDTRIRQVCDGEADMYITNRHPFEVWEGVDTVRLLRQPAQIAVSLSHPWAKKTEITEQDMAGMPILLLSMKHPLSPDSFYSKVPALRCDYAPDFATMLAELELAQHYAVFPRLFENSKWSKLRFFDLPAPMRFVYETVCAYKEDNRFAPLFAEMKQHFEAEPLKLDL